MDILKPTIDFISAHLKEPALLVYALVGALTALPYMKSLSIVATFVIYSGGVAGSYTLGSAAIAIAWIQPEFAGVFGFFGGLISMNVVSGVWRLSAQFSQDPMTFATKAIDLVRSIWRR